VATSTSLVSFNLLRCIGVVTKVFVVALVAPSTGYAEARLNTSIGTEFNSNVWDLSKSNIQRFRSNPTTDRDIESVHDWIISAQVNLHIRENSTSKNSFVTTIESFHHADNTVLDYRRGELSWRHRLGKGRNIWLNLAYTPDQFLGSSENDGKRTKAEVNKKQINLKYSWWPNGKNAALVEYRYAEDDYTQYTADLDANINRLRASWLYRWNKQTRVKSSFLYQQRRPEQATPDNDIGSDSLGVHVALSHKLASTNRFLAAVGVTVKDYTSSIRDDSFHYKRQDRRYSFSTGLDTDISENSRLSTRIGYRAKRSNIEQHVLNYSAWWVSITLGRSF
jgi:hypothetical protein